MMKLIRVTDAGLEPTEMRPQVNVCLQLDVPIFKEFITLYEQDMYYLIGKEFVSLIKNKIEANDL